MLPDIVGVYPSEIFEHLSVLGGNPFVLRQLHLVISIEGHDFELIAEKIKHFSCAPYSLLHLPAVHASVSGDVHEYRLSACLGSLKRIFH